MPSEISFPLDPLTTRTGPGFDNELRRRAVAGVLDSYHGSYDVPGEAIQNAVDAVEDAKLLGIDGPYLIEVVINLSENWMRFVDTGVGMEFEQVAKAFAPHVSFKETSEARSRRDRRNMYRGFKGIGMTFLAYGTDDITIHSKREGNLTRARMQYGRAWATGKRAHSALLTLDPNDSPLDKHPRGTLVQVQFSQHTRPRSLTHLASTMEIWKTILRTKTAIGQVMLACDGPVVDLKVELTIIDGEKKTTESIEPAFLYPHNIVRNPAFRFLDIVKYHKTHPEQTAPPQEKLRQDGVYLDWDTERIEKQLTDEQKKQFADPIEVYTPSAYAFVPYQGSVWGDLNKLATGHQNRNYLYPGLMIAVNRQRLADIFEIEASRFETFSRNVFVAVHFHGAKPDHGRKTIDAESTTLAKKIADRIVQYLADQRALLRPPGEGPTPEQRQVEKDHEDWIFNVKIHQQSHPLHIPPVAYVSTPLTEQDVVGLFHQLCALGLFAGAKVYATSQSQTYDCLMEYDCPRATAGLAYIDAENNALGVSPYTLGGAECFSTRKLTVEFKNNLDGLIDDVEGDRSPKQFENIDICVCWSKVGDTFRGYELEQITPNNLDRRQFPGVTHLLSHNGNPRAMSIIMLKTVTDMMLAGSLTIPVEA